MIDIKYKNIYDKFIEHYKTVHVNPWHEISEKDLTNIYTYLINLMDITDNFTFNYFINYIIKRLSGESDAHTYYDAISLLPMNFKIFGAEVFVNYPDNLKGSKVISINGVSIHVILSELEEIITYGTKGKKKEAQEKALLNEYMLLGLPSLRGSNNLIFEINSLNGEKEIIEYPKKETNSDEEITIYNNYRFGTYPPYNFIDNCLVYHHPSNQNNFKERIESSISELRKADLSNIDTIIIDIRGNTGGNASLNKIIIDFLKEHLDKKLICLTDYRVFSAGRYALRDLINIDAITIGEEIGTPINCYGNSNWINIDSHAFSSSEAYYHPLFNLSISSKDEFKEKMTDELLKPVIFKPDILVEETKEDYLNGIDTILNYAISYSKENIIKK